MPRTVKCRQVCMEPRCSSFTPDRAHGGAVTLSVEQLEALRLCDLEGLEQDDAAVRMNVSRGTLQRILYAARHLVADALVSGKIIEIRGGNYEVVDAHCACQRECRHCKFAKNKE